MNGSIFQHFPKFKLQENFGKIFCSKFGTKLVQLVYELIIFSWNLVFVWVYFQILRRHFPQGFKLNQEPISLMFNNSLFKRPVLIAKPKNDYHLAIVFKNQF